MLFHTQNILWEKDTRKESRVEWKAGKMREKIIFQHASGKIWTAEEDKKTACWINVTSHKLKVCNQNILV